jgi:hypothetical protein
MIPGTSGASGFKLTGYPMAKKTILSDHKRIGKRFIPPMKQLPQMRSIGFVDDMLPELIWLGLINDRIGFVGGAKLFEKVVAAATEIERTDQQKTNYACISLYGSFNEAQKEAFLKGLSSRSLLVPLQEYLAPLVLLYDECPLRFIGPPSTVYSESSLVKLIRDCVSHHADKYETPGIVLNGMMLLSRLITKSIHFSSDIELPNFNAVIDAPGSEEAKRAAGFMRANAIGEFGMLGIDRAWAKNFWNRGYELSKCEFAHATDE